MVSVSFSVSAGADVSLGGITTGTSAPGTGDLEIRINATNVRTRKEAYKLIDKVRRYILYGDQTVFKP